RLTTCRNDELKSEWQKVSRLKLVAINSKQSVQKIAPKLLNVYDVCTLIFCSHITGTVIEQLAEIQKKEWPMIYSNHGPFFLDFSKLLNNRSGNVTAGYQGNGIIIFI
ncbi:MAG: hypothetical protein KAR13_11825, partial [Desulfobulbaceae bacterium]|nr:hypothetical protein [Desulfobulbaceae bacterium]